MDWLRLNCRRTKKSPCSGINWGVVFPFGIWSLWLHRNSVVFSKERTWVDLKKEVMAKAIEYAYLETNGRSSGLHTTIKVSWHRPPANWVKLNTNGSFIRNPGLAGGGGLIRNANKEWVQGFARAIGTTTIAFELWALHDGIRLCIALKCPVVIIELDAKLVVDLLHREDRN